MKRPEHVDKEAQWRFEGWHKGRLSSKGQPKGRYTIWDDSGMLLHDAEYSSRGQILWLKSYYPDGSVGRDVVYDKAKNQTTVTYRSYYKHCDWLITPLALSDERYGVKIYAGALLFNNSEIYNGSAEGVSFYRESGDLVFTSSNEPYEQLIENFSQKSANETWKEALNRLEKYSEALYQQFALEDYEAEEDYFSVQFRTDVSQQDLAEAERRLGIQLPKSYRKFVLENGLLTFGQIETGYGYAQSMLDPRELKTVDACIDPEQTGDFDKTFHLSREERSKLIVFFVDQEDGQYEGWIGFDCSNDQADECPVIDQIGYYTISDWEHKIGKGVNLPGNSMDVFVSNYVDTLIKEREA